MNIKTYYDIILIIVLRLTLLLVLEFTSLTILRLIIGIPFILFVPGYVFVSAIFPTNDKITANERFIYSFASSFALTALIGLILNYWYQISLYGVLVILDAEIFITVIIILFRRRSNINISVPKFPLNWYKLWSRETLVNKILIVILTLLVLITSVVGIYVFNNNAERYTEFYILSEAGRAEGYPQNLHVGEKGYVTLVVVNQERQSITYQIECVQDNGEVRVDGESTNHFTVLLDKGDEWRKNISFSFDTIGNGQKLEFLLYKENQVEPYLRTYLRVNILE